jgi:hypothetical protein
MNPVGFPIGYISPAVKNNNVAKAPASRQAQPFTNASICVVASLARQPAKDGVTGDQ